MMTEWTPDAIRALRVERLGLSLFEFAELLFANFTTVWRWERGDMTPSPAYQRELARLAARANQDAKLDAALSREAV